jgi:hypothetical protein
MIDAKFIVNLYYSPTDELKAYIDNNLSIYIPVNSGSLLESDD